MKSNKHIVWLCQGFAANEQDDTCIPAQQVFLKSFQTHHPDFQITIISFQYPFFAGIYNYHATKVYSIGGKNKKWLKKIHTWKKACDIFKQLHSEKPIDLIHSFWFSECMVVGNYLSRKYKLPHINTLMGQDVLPANRYLRKYFYDKTLTVALSKRHANEFTKNTSKIPDYIIPFGIDEIELDETSIKDYDVVAVGSLVNVKRYQLLMEAVSIIKKKRAEFKAIIIGDGPEKKGLMQKAGQFGLGNSVFFAGSLPRSEVLDMMSRCKVFVHTSAFEGVGFVYLEAMLCGLPIVSYPAGIIENSETAKIVNSVDELADAVLFFLDSQIITKRKLPITAKQTADAYYQLYQKVSKSP
jgi:glycosyltransferase involved in cell wall biosynthesis